MIYNNNNNNNNINITTQHNTVAKMNCNNCIYTGNIVNGLMMFTVGVFYYNVNLIIFTNDRKKYEQIKQFGRLCGTYAMTLSLLHIVEYSNVLNYLKINIFSCNYMPIVFFGLNMFTSGLFLHDASNMISKQSIDND